MDYALDANIRILGAVATHTKAYFDACVVTDDPPIGPPVGWTREFEAAATAFRAALQLYLLSDMGRADLAKLELELRNADGTPLND